MPTNPPPVAQPPAEKPDGVRGRRDAAIRANVLAALGTPSDLWRVAVFPLWGDHYRVNVLTGADPTSLRMPHSFFLSADDRLNIIQSSPPIVRLF